MDKRAKPDKRVLARMSSNLMSLQFGMIILQRAPP